MTAEGTFPKSNNDELYASEVNDFYNYPKRILNTTSTSTTFTPTKSDSMIMVTAKGYVDWSGVVDINTDVDLDIDSSTVDKIKIQVARVGSPSGVSKTPFTLIYSADDLSAESHDIEITTSSGTIYDLKIIIMEYTKE